MSKTPEPEVVITCRGFEFHFPAHVSILDVVYAVNGQRGQAWDEKDTRIIVKGHADLREVIRGHGWEDLLD